MSSEGTVTSVMVHGVISDNKCGFKAVRRKQAIEKRTRFLVSLMEEG
jgi:hypothetical protein